MFSGTRYHDPCYTYGPDRSAQCNVDGGGQDGYVSVVEAKQYENVASAAEAPTQHYDGLKSGTNKEQTNKNDANSDCW